MQQRQDFMQRGKTYAGTDNTVDNTNTLGTYMEGQCAEFRDINPATGKERSGRMVRCMLVRNTASVNLKPRRLTKIDLSTGCNLTKASGYTSSVAEATLGVVDEFLPEAGVAPGNLFWVVINGPTLVQTRAAGDNVAVAVGDWVCATTGTSATNDDAGRVNGSDFGGTRGAVYLNILNKVGRALATATVSTANAQFLIHVGNGLFDH